MPCAIPKESRERAERTSGFRQGRQRNRGNSALARFTLAMKVGATLFADYTIAQTPKVKDADGNDPHRETPTGSTSAVSS
jgi:hypothetical protein